MNHQIDQLKEEISTKESALVKEHLEHQRVEKDKVRPAALATNCSGWSLMDRPISS